MWHRSDVSVPPPGAGKKGLAVAVAVAASLAEGERKRAFPNLCGPTHVNQASSSSSLLLVVVFPANGSAALGPRGGRWPCTSQRRGVGSRQKTHSLGPESTFREIPAFV